MVTHNTLLSSPWGPLLPCQKIVRIPISPTCDNCTPCLVTGWVVILRQHQRSQYVRLTPKLQRPNDKPRRNVLTPNNTTKQQPHDCKHIASHQTTQFQRAVRASDEHPRREEPPMTQHVQAAPPTGIMRQTPVDVSQAIPRSHLQLPSSSQSANDRETTKTKDLKKKNTS